MIIKRQKRKGVRDYVMMLRLCLALPRALRMGVSFLLDNRVSLKLKALPLFALIYFILPIDFLPDFLPFPGYLDDLFLFFFLMERTWGLLPVALKKEYLERFYATEPTALEALKMLRGVNNSVDRKLQQSEKRLKEQADLIDPKKKTR